MSGLPQHVQGRLLASREVARRLGIKTSTLAKWRAARKDPAGAVAISTTLVCYPEESVVAFVEAKRSAPRPLGVAARNAAKRAGEDATRRKTKSAPATARP